jgi:plasmid stabilization system protein ParE
MAEYRLSPAAEHDLENIWLYTCRQWSVGQAEHYIDMLGAAFGELASPRFALSLGKCTHQLARDLRRRPIDGLGLGHELCAQLGFQLRCENSFFRHDRPRIIVTV